MQKLEINIAEPFRELLTVHKRYKLFYGGRAGGKSFAFADALLTLATSRKLLIACVREVQNSIKDSVYKLIADRIAYHNLNATYRLYDDKIVNLTNGSKFIFKGIMEHNAQNIKSLEGVNICWVEEAQKLSAHAWEILNPTIRHTGSEIWLSMNREEDMDPVWKALALKPDEDTLVRKVNFYDNPYCPLEMKKLALKTKAENFNEYLHIWEGEPRAESADNLIARADVYRAMNTVDVVVSGTSPLIMGVDVARFGDDKTAICLRAGREVKLLEAYAKLDVVNVAHLVAGMIAKYYPARVLIDVGGLGAGVYDVLSSDGFREILVPVNFGERAENAERFVNRRAEMWGRLKEWLQSPLPVKLPKVDGLAEDLTAPKFSFDSLGRLQLEAKAEIKKRLGRSTDFGDALALTFAFLHEEYLLKNLLGQRNREFISDDVFV